MKQYIFVFCAMSALIGVHLVAILSLAGCSTVHLEERDITPAVKTAAYVGTHYALEEHPDWRPGFETAARELVTIETAEAIDFAQILSIVNRLPVEEMRSQNATLIITGATILLSEYGERVVALDHVEQLRPIAAALRQGIELGLK